MSGRGSKEKTARIVHSLRESYQLKDILTVVKLPKATYMYWQKRFDRLPKDAALEEKIKAIRDNFPPSSKLLKLYRTAYTAGYFIPTKDGPTK